MQAIVICTVNSPSIHVLMESIAQYVPEIPIYVCGSDLGLWSRIREKGNVIWRPNSASNFGDAYNSAVDHAFEDGYDSLIIANDDVVLTPNSYRLLNEDYEFLKDKFKVGFVGARSDYVLHDQNIRFPIEGDSVSVLKYRSEEKIKETSVIAPIFAAISKEAWGEAKFPSINWFSDNIICMDMARAGFQHFVSRAYVHHVGSQTVGMDYEKCLEEPKAWLQANRPDMYDIFYG